MPLCDLWDFNAEMADRDHQPDRNSAVADEIFNRRPTSRENA
jgi:hypothetical protein